MDKCQISYQLLDVVVIDAMCWTISDFLQDNFMLVADSNLNNIYQVSLLNGSTQSLFVNRPVGTSPIGVAYDPTTYDVYYTDNGLLTKSISKYSLTSKTFITVYEDVNGKWLHILSLYYGRHEWNPHIHLSVTAFGAERQFNPECL
jgi:hypothetical protein